MNKLIFITLLFFPLFLFSQNCDCESNFNWVKKTFEENDAGFSYAIENKGKQVYEKHNEVFIQKIKTITKLNECTNTIYEWLTFFRSGHIAIKRLNQESSQNNSKELNSEEIIEQYKDAENIDIDLKEFNKYLELKKEIDYEGIWISEPYKIGIKKIKNEYVGFIIEADEIYWTKGQIKFKINSDNSSVYFMRDHSKQVFESIKLLGNNYIQMGFITLKRIKPKYNNNTKIDQYFKSIATEKPYFEVLNDKTTYLRIPTFRGSEKKIIDSVILANKELILKTPNLIIDIQNNGGGSDGSFKELLSILYTNPIRTVGVELLSTPLNNQRMLDFINNPKWGFDAEEKKWAKESYDKLNKQIGSFVNLDSTIVNITTYDTVYPLPKNIGIIINENNGSTAEQFLLAAKQSRKVKLFGTTTTGVLDISNMYFVKSPCEEFELGYSLSRSMRIPEMTIDNKGIQPDYYIDKSIPKYEWIDFVAKLLNE
ncbi:MAG: peptidase S41 [Flavobacteriales bacterium]|nr:peptidase S41 [Flavobacteriales bacterium]